MLERLAMPEPPRACSASSTFGLASNTAAAEQADRVEEVAAASTGA
jgi:hypothetical protein